MSDEPVRVAGPPGSSYEARWTRRTLRARHFTGCVAEVVEGGSCDLWTCPHKHEMAEAAVACAAVEAARLAAAAIRHWQELHSAASDDALRAELARQFPEADAITFADGDGSDPRVVRLRRCEAGRRFGCGCDAECLGT